MSVPGSALCFLCCYSVVLLGTSLPSLIIAGTDGENTCQGHDKTDLSLKDWLIGYGASDLGMLVTMWICFASLLCCGSEGGKSVSTVVMIFVGVLWVLFKFSWFVIGIVITARSHGACVADGTDIGVMTVVALALQTISSMTVGGSSKASINID